MWLLTGTELVVLGGGAALVAAGVLTAARVRPRLTLLEPAYWHFLRRPWKLITFAAAAGFFVLIAPFSGDPTWDAVDALLMSVATFLSAPWAVGVAYRTLRGQVRWPTALVAVSAWYFSVSWVYEFYLVLRDGMFPPTWASNLLASSVLYVCAGLMWSLEHRPGRGVTFAFLEPVWLSREAETPLAVLAVAAVFATLVAAMMAPFMWAALH